MNQTAKLHVERRVPAVGSMSRPIKDFQVPSVENPDGTISPVAQIVIPLDVNTEPNTYTMPSSMFVSKNGVLEVVRTPTTFRTAPANVIGSTALWTPASGRRCRVMGYTFTLPSTATSAAGTTITLMDNATAIFTLIVMGTTSGALSASVMLPGNGYLSTAADNILNINLTAALTVGNIAVSVWGTEE